MKVSTFKEICFLIGCCRILCAGFWLVIVKTTHILTYISEHCCIFGSMNTFNLYFARIRTLWTDIAEKKKDVEKFKKSRILKITCFHLLYCLKSKSVAHFAHLEYFMTSITFDFLLWNGLLIFFYITLFVTKRSILLSFDVISIWCRKKIK